MKKKLFLPVLILVAVLFLSGCYHTETTFDINENGKAKVDMLVQANEIIAGDEVNTAMWGLINSFPELQNNYTITTKNKTIDYTDYIIYNLQSKEKFDIKNMNNISFSKDNDKYRFEMEIPKLITDTNESNKNDVMFVIKVNLPKEIDMANSSNYNNKQVTWKLTREQLSKGLTLKAFTK